MAKRILLADDSITIQKVISITFASEDYELVIAGDGDTAVKKAREARPDLVMADVAMPGKTGYEVCEAVKNDPALKGVPVLLLAGTFEPLNKDEALRVGADDSIIKPFESQELLDKVRDLLSVAGTGTVEAAVPASPQPSESELGADIWSAGDFLSAPEEFEERKEETGAAPDLDFLSSGALFEEEAHKEEEGRESDFTDLVIPDEEMKSDTKEERKEESPIDLSASPFDLSQFDAFKPEHTKPEPAFDMGVFDTFIEEEKKAETVELDTFEPEPVKPWEVSQGEPVKPFWEDFASIEQAVETRDEQTTAEPDLLEIHEEVMEAPSRAEEGIFAEARPLRELISAPSRTEPQVSEDEVRKVVERAADRVEERLIADLNLKLKKAEAQVADAIEKTAARVEEKLRADLNAKLAKVDSIVAEAARSALVKMEERLKSELGTRLEKSLAIPKEQVEAIVARTSKQVVEHVAWEVLPELAERLIKTEISKVKEALVRLR